MVVFGLGGIGLNVIQGARLVGADMIVGVDLNSGKEQIGRKFGMTHFVNPKEVEGDLVAYLVDLTKGGADYSFECIGNVDVMRQALECCHKGWGESVIIGVAGAGQEIATRPFQLVTGRVWRGTAFGGARGRTDVPRIVDWYMEGKINIDDLITHTMPLEDIKPGLRPHARRGVDPERGDLLAGATGGPDANDTGDEMSDLLERCENGVATLTMNRPDSLNALSAEMMDGLLEAIPRLARDASVGCIVVGGAGRAFSAGGDVKAMARDEEFAGTLEERAQSLRDRMEIARLLHESPKPTIAAVRGAAAGAGLSIALSCDLRLAAASARFVTAFARVGYSGDFGGSWFLTQLVGSAKARELLLPLRPGGRGRGPSPRYRQPGVPGRRLRRGGPEDRGAYRGRPLHRPSLHEAQLERGGEPPARRLPGPRGVGPYPLRPHRGPQGSRPRLRREAHPGLQGPLIEGKRGRSEFSGTSVRTWRGSRRLTLAPFSLPGRRRPEARPRPQPEPCT